MKFQIPLSVMYAEFLKDPVAGMKVIWSTGGRKSSSQLTDGKKLAHKEGVSDSTSDQTIPNGRWIIENRGVLCCQQVFLLKMY